MPTNIEQLIKYESEDKYVFHGSINGDLGTLEPLQALSFKKPDGDPGVFAASNIEPAIFMAVLGSRHAAGWDVVNLLNHLDSTFLSQIGNKLSKRIGKVGCMYWIGHHLLKERGGYGAAQRSLHH